MRRGVAPSKGGTSVSSGTGIFVDGAKDQEGVYQCSAGSSHLEVFVLVGNHVRVSDGSTPAVMLTSGVYNI